MVSKAYQVGDLSLDQNTAAQNSGKSGDSLGSVQKLY